MVYSNTDQEKESQKLMNDLLEYNISQVYAGGNHFFCKGKKRNQLNDDNANLIFSWGNNSYGQCGLDNEEYDYINTPYIIFKNISVKDISLGNNHSIIMTNNCEIILFGDNQYFQCCNENKNIQKLVENKNALPLINVSFYTTPIDYLIKNDEIINKIEAKGDSSMIITNKKTIILKGKITEGKDKYVYLKDDEALDNYVLELEDKLLKLYSKLEKYNDVDPNKCYNVSGEELFEILDIIEDRK